MNHIKTILGKALAVVWNDFDFHQAATEEAFYGLLTAFGVSVADSFRISGCTVNIAGVTYTVVAGYICLEGEILKVDAHSVDVQGGEAAYWDIIETNDAAGYKEDSDGTYHDTYKVRKAKLYAAAAPVSGLPYNCDTLQDKIIGLASRDLAEKAYSTVDYSPVLLNGWALGTSATGYTIRYKKDQFGYLELIGVVIPTNRTSDVVFRLPSGFHPIAAQGTFRGRVEEFGGISLACTLDEAGDFTIIGSSAAATAYYIHLRIRL